MRISTEPKLRVHAKLRVSAQEGPTEWGGTEPSEWGNLIDPDVIPPEKQKLVEAPAPEQVQTKRQRDTRIRKLEELRDEHIKPLIEQGGPQAEAARQLYEQLGNQMESINQMNQVGSDYYNWLQEQPAQLNPKEWGPGKKWKTPEAIPSEGPPPTGWEAPEAPQETPKEAPRFPPAQQTPKPKKVETAPQQPVDLSQEQSQLDQAALEQKALDLDRFLDDAEQKASQMLEALRAPDSQIKSNPAAFKRELSQLVNYLDGEIARVRPLADSLLAQIGGGEQAPAKASPEQIDTTDFEKYFPDQG